MQARLLTCPRGSRQRASRRAPAGMEGKAKCMMGTRAGATDRGLPGAPGPAGQSPQHVTQELPPTPCGTEPADTALRACAGVSQACSGHHGQPAAPRRPAISTGPLSCGHRGAGPMSAQLAGEGRSFLLSMRALCGAGGSRWDPTPATRAPVQCRAPWWTRGGACLRRPGGQ